MKSEMRIQMGIKSIATVVAVLTLVCATGCQQMKLVFHQPAPARVHHRDEQQRGARRVMLASMRADVNGFEPSNHLGWQPSQRDLQDEPHPKPPPPRAVDKNSAQQPTKSSQETQQPVKDKPTKGDGKQNEGSPSDSTAEVPPSVGTIPYTVPSSAYQQLAVAVAGGVVGAFADATGAGRELSESVMFSSEGVGGRLGLTAPPTRTAGSVVGKSGLQRGDATGLGFASPNRTILTRQINRLSGANGGCAQLARAGFLGGNRHNCPSTLRR